MKERSAPPSLDVERNAGGAKQWKTATGEAVQVFAMLQNVKPRECL